MSSDGTAKDRHGTGRKRARPGMAARPAARRRWGAVGVVALAAPALALATGCITTLAEFRKLERRVSRIEKTGPAEGATNERLAEIAARVESMQRDLERLQGRIEVAEHNAELARREASEARRESVSPRSESTPAGDPSEAKSAEDADGADDVAAAGGSAEVQAYRHARGAWRKGDTRACIDRFRNFLQLYPASPYADDAAYWLADCHYQEGDFKTAILRFDDVVARYPTGNRAADALYRHGEALLQLGPEYSTAASQAFERVLKEYPGSARTPEAKRQLELLGSG